MNIIGHLQSTTYRLKRIYIEAKLPEPLQPLRTLANNLWWCWNKEAIELFRFIAGNKWETEYGYNPIAVLDDIAPATMQQLVKDEAFMARLARVNQRFETYMADKSAATQAQIAYFCMEYGLHASLQLYSGGLGVLAGDYMKEASDSNVNMIAVGLLYRYGYFTQGLSLYGDQINHYPAQKFTQLPLHPVKDEKGEWLKIDIGLRGRKVFAKIWEVKIGRISLYLLDTDLDDNHWEDRALTHQLYGGDNEHRLKQEILLGIGGVRALQKMNLQPDIFHLNEGHAAFSGLERLRMLVNDKNLTFDEAVEVVRSTSLFTTHTPVPAGHDYFGEALLKSYIYQYAYELNVQWKDIVALGKIDADNIQEAFSMSHLAIRLSQEVNGVSHLHGLVSQKMFDVLYPGYHADELHIGYVTNGVHYPTWISNQWHLIFNKYFGEDFLQDQSNKAYWRKINEVPAAEIVAVRQNLKKQLIDYVKTTIKVDLTKRGENPAKIFSTLKNINENALTIGFARRFATYKRAHLLFTNLERLAKIVNNPEQPVVFIFSGKAHPADKGGQALIKRIVEISKRPEFAGKVIFLENYNMESAKLLVQGVDVWLNTPTRPKEASGTSGMKAAMNGVVNFSVLDGWWAEGYRPDAGWALPLERTYNNQELQNELDAEQIYNILETEIVPTYYDKNEEGISEKWVSYVRNIIAEVSPDFTMKRMIDHYQERFYSKLAERSSLINKDRFKTAKILSAWKGYLKAYWDAIEVVNMDVFDTDNFALPLGEAFTAKIQLNLNDLPADNVGLEVVFFKRLTEKELEIKLVKTLENTHTSGAIATFKCTIPTEMAGVYEYGFRMYPKHELLAHRQDFAMVRWL